MNGTGRPSRWEWLGLGVVLGMSAALRLTRLDLIEFKGDEAYATHVVLRALHGGGWPAVGLMSSVKVANPPLFLYMLAPLFAISESPVFVTACIAVLNVAAVLICWHVGRRYYGAVAGFVAAALFAVSPWAVLYSRKIWAQDLVPLLAAGTLWALHALVCDGRRRAVFWVVVLPLLVIQVHFSGLALSATVLAILFMARAKMDWRWATAGAVAAGLLMVPYLRHQIANDWTDFRQAAQTVGGQAYKIPKGMLVHPQLGYSMPRRDSWWQALGILNDGSIEDILGVSARPELDTDGVWRVTQGDSVKYFRDGWRWWPDGVLAAQQGMLVAALAWLAARGYRRWKTERAGPVWRTDWMLVIWCVGPVAVFVASRLWTVQSYFVILYPALFLVLGVAVAELTSRWRMVMPATVVLLAVANVWFLMSLWQYLDRYGGAHGGYGTVMGHKLAAARFLREQVDMEELMAKKRYWQMDQWGKVERARLELPVLAGQLETGGNVKRGADIGAVLVVDMNRCNFSQPPASVVSQLMNGRNVTTTNFGPMCLYLVGRDGR